MAQQDYTVGSDTKLTILSDGRPIKATILTSFSAKQSVAEVESVGLDGVVRYRTLEKGWDVNLEFDRGDSTIDDFFAAKEAARYAGAEPPQIVVTTSIRNPDLSLSRYRFEGLALKLEDAGTYKGDAKVEQKVSGKASRRVKA